MMSEDTGECVSCDKLSEQVEKLRKERNAFQDQCIRLKNERAVEKGQLAALAERIKELETEFAGCSELLDNADRIMEQQSAALNLAKDAFSAISIEAKTFMSYENARNNFSDDTDERKAHERAMIKASELTKQAIAAIDALKGE